MKKLATLLLLMGLSPGATARAAAGELDEEKAEKYLLVLAQDPTNELVFERLVLLYTKAGRKEELARRLRQALEAHPNSLAEATILARLLAREDKVKQARDLLAAAALEG